MLQRMAHSSGGGSVGHPSWAPNHLVHTANAVALDHDPTLADPVADFEVFADVDRIMSVVGTALSNAIKVAPLGATAE
ncbi:hypothetical protein FNF28_07507 [Cafeteria roenbergensis]|uniref:Uncharacterized protein n=1 Tax=Cafeteria roenbergensis TaxID=33653 RepID=A0A5A8C5X9_CAFRO|nr:hypothetical protein FNF28_07507 [Cafeteria roenbergensis]